MPDIFSWDQSGIDWGQANETWDQPDYTTLITPQHADKPKFVASIQALTQPLIDIMNTLLTMPSQFDLDTAVGSQLDIDGLWIGISRELPIPLTGVFFAFDTDLVGWDQGTWLGPFDDEDQLTTLPDDSYRTLLYAKIANNQWNGTVPNAYQVLNTVLPGNQVVIQDDGDMTMMIGVLGTTPLNAVTTALLENGYLDVKPVGVQVFAYITPSVTGGVPFFGFDIENSVVDGWDIGGWATLTGGR